MAREIHYHHVVRPGFLQDFIERRTQFHQAVLADHVTAFNNPAINRLKSFSASFMARGDDFSTARMKALAMINGAVHKQAALLSYLDAFYVVGFFFLLCIPMLLLFRKPAGKEVDLSHASMME